MRHDLTMRGGATNISDMRRDPCQTEGCPNSADVRLVFWDTEDRQYVKVGYCVDHWEAERDEHERDDDFLGTESA